MKVFRYHDERARWRLGWEDDTGVYLKCPECGTNFRKDLLEMVGDEENLPHYCPHCGVYIDDSEGIGYLWPDGEYRGVRVENRTPEQAEEIMRLSRERKERGM